jgi:hypothetical protein
MCIGEVKMSVFNEIEGVMRGDVVLGLGEQVHGQEPASQPGPVCCI